MRGPAGPAGPGGGTAGGQFHFDPTTYLAMVRAQVPAFDELQDVVAAACTAGEGAVALILELGTGTGETARRVLARCPGASLVGVDESDAMLDQALRVLDPARVRLVVGRLQDPLPQGPFDVVCSALAVHHLDAGDKRALFAAVRQVLRPGGRFVLADVVVPETDPGDGEKRTPVNDAHDKPDTAEDQLRWLEAAGFDARVTWSAVDLVVMVADVPGRGAPTGSGRPSTVG